MEEKWKKYLSSENLALAEHLERIEICDDKWNAFVESLDADDKNWYDWYCENDFTDRHQERGWAERWARQYQDWRGEEYGEDEDMLYLGTPIPDQPN